jgi:hypothetical protein
MISKLEIKINKKNTVYSFKNQIDLNYNLLKTKKNISKLYKFRNGFPPNTIHIGYYSKYLFLKHPFNNLKWRGFLSSI